MGIHGHSRLVPRVAVELSQCVQALSFFVYQTLPLSQRVSLIKTGLYAESHASAFRDGDGL